jgi:hypothetical protein
MGWAGYMACRKERVLVGKSREHPCVDGRIMLNRILKIKYGRAWTGFIWLDLGNKWQAVVKMAVNLLVPQCKCAVLCTLWTSISIPMLAVIKSFKITVIVSELSRVSQLLISLLRICYLESEVWKAE